MRLAEHVEAMAVVPEPAEVEWEYAGCLLVADNPDVYEMHKGPWIEPREVDEGYYLMKRTATFGPWVPVEKGAEQ